jgi:hypothetical protein
VIQAQDFLPEKMDRVLLHHRRENNKIFIFYKKFVSFFFLVGVIQIDIDDKVACLLCFVFKPFNISNADYSSNNINAIAE